MIFITEKYILINKYNLIFKSFFMNYLFEIIIEYKLYNF